jgi:hypothetical protein
MTSTREVHADGWRVRLGIDRQVLRLEVPEAANGWQRGRRPAEPPLAPVLPRSEAGPVSAATLLLKAKQVDDRLYASIELAAQQGAGRFAGKAALLRSLAATLATARSGADIAAAVMLHAACRLGNVPVVVPEDLAEPVHWATAGFLADERLSWPLGFYNQSNELTAIFRQDRFLQQPLNPDTADILTHTLEQTPGALEAYNACLRLNARLTNPPKKLTIWDAGKRPPFFPPSRSHEVSLFESLYEYIPVPEEFDLMGELIRRIRSGEIHLLPTEQSGWYDHQTWSLEPLLLPDRMPERAHLELGKRYRKHLEDLFRGALALVRETHVKQAGGGWGGGCGGFRERPIWINPNLSIEPLPSLYMRRAASYRFLRTVLEEAFGVDAFNALPAFTAEGTSKTSLARELERAEKLFLGTSAITTKELGMGTAGAGDDSAGCFSEWRGALHSDADVSRDARMMAPVFYDVERKKTKVWVFLGWRTTPVDVSYRVPPIVLAVEPLQPGRRPAGAAPPVLFYEDRYELAVPVMAEVYVSRVLDRDEMRRHCDRFRSRAAILANLR